MSVRVIHVRMAGNALTCMVRTNATANMATMETIVR